MEGGHFIRKLTGDWPVYPGHPLVLATLIMELYPNFAEANKPTEHGWCEALGDQRVPGAGCHVGAAMRVLHLGSNGGSADEMIAFANDYWELGQAGGHCKNVEAGRQQAEKLHGAFRERVDLWFPVTA